MVDRCLVWQGLQGFRVFDMPVDLLLEELWEIPLVLYHKVCYRVEF